ncbi:MAG TPA: potassium-transporting ATPase subunit KdpC, partial [Gemmatimonadales bacterium]|nr:potassium-transporting ATPase subunit KdpC [Gemmatimonadales bacterium]
MRTLLRPGLTLLGVLMVLTGLVYPAVVTGLAQLAFPRQANASLIVVAGRVRGSELIGQPFTAPEYFWSRPSATALFPYNAVASGGSNLGPSNPALVEALRLRLGALRAADSTATGPVPIDLVTSSASGLDPDISPAGAAYQVARVARARGLPADSVRALVRRA